MSPEPVRVLVLYSHPLMGEGLGRMLASEPGVLVDAVDVIDAPRMEAALATDPAVIVVEEGGAVDAAEIMRRSNCPIVLDVDINTTRAWTLRRETLGSRPDDFLAAIRSVVGTASPAGHPSGKGRRTDAQERPDPDDRPGGERGRQPVVVPG